MYEVLEHWIQYKYNKNKVNTNQLKLELWENII
jgi:hypothetical protein